MIISRIWKSVKDLKHGALSIREYKDRFDEIIEYFQDLSDKDKQIFFVTGLQNSIKFDVRALKPYTLEKAYSMALTFEAKNIELAKENNFSFDVSRKDHSREKKIGKWKKSQKFSRPEGQSNVRPSNKRAYKDQAEHWKKWLCYNCHEPGHLAKDCLRPTGK